MGQPHTAGSHRAQCDAPRPQTLHPSHGPTCPTVRPPAATAPASSVGSGFSYKSGGSNPHLLPEILVDTDTYLDLFDTESEDAYDSQRASRSASKWFLLDPKRLELLVGSVAADPVLKGGGGGAVRWGGGVKVGGGVGEISNLSLVPHLQRQLSGM